MKNNSNTQYRIATFAAVMGLITYGFMRYFEGGSYSTWSDQTKIPFYLSICTALIVVIEYFMLKRFEYMPFVVVSTMIATMTAGAYISSEWDYYYLTTLGMTGIMCLYGKVRPMILHQIVNAVVNICVLLFLLNDAAGASRPHMVNSFLLYLYAAFFLVVMFYQANKKEGEAQSGLQAFSSLLASTPNLMVIVDDKRRVRYISAPLAKFAGLDESVAIGRPLVDLFKTESLKLMFADILDAESFYSATREIDVNDESHYFKVMADKLSETDAGMFIEITDMTEIVEVSMAAEKSRQEAEAANRSKSAFLTTMSHEIRTPMNAIIGISEIQLLTDGLPEETVRALRQIHTSGHGLLAIINDILDLSKIETGKLEINPIEYDVASLINDAVTLNIIRIGSKLIRFSLEVDGSLPARMVGDEIRLKQILNNILSNAFKYTDEGTITLTVSHHVTDEGIELTFTVADTGQGMRSEDVARLYDQYTRFNSSSNRTTEGTGLGMNITRSLVHMMRGKIDVESEYGKGSVFTVTVLQQAAADSSVIGEEHADRLRNFTYTMDRKTQGSNIPREYMPYGRVLVVDDVATNLYVARGLLAPYGLQIDTASSGFEAIEKIKAGELYDIVFMDHMMPKMDGIETTEKLRAKGYNGTIVALTANAIAGNDALFKSRGFEDFISKPIDMRQMNLVLNRYIRDRHNLESSEWSEIDASSATELKVDAQLLEIFKKDAADAIETLSSALQAGDYKLFTTTAHAMKSACANVGAMEISALAKQLEDAGNSVDVGFMENHTPEFISALRSAIGADEVEAPEDTDNPEEDIAYLRESLERICRACNDYDGSAARSCLKELRGKSWSKATVEALEQISEMVLCSDFEEAVQRLEDWCGSLN